MEFSTDQRNAKNALEGITILVFALFVLLFVWPIAAIVLGLVHVVARIGYGISYRIGVQKRLPFYRILATAQGFALLTAIAATIYWQVKVRPL